ncbi:MAG: formyltransferase family protein [Marivibrio sp.]|uniref:methionyl-tRNA formyltransferase n=1 Tax=Marivibrio sp. TaxID=2039719 RepID=UPI0032EC5347
MKIGFVGTVESSAALLKATLAAGGDVAAVGALPPEVGAARHADYVDLAPIAAEAGAPLYDLSTPDGLQRLVAQSAPDVLFVFGWSRLIPNDLLAGVPMGGVGFHPAPLPIGRGRHPLIWSIVLGLQESAACFMRLTEEADAGAVFVQRPFAIADDETARSLMDKAIAAATAAVPDLLHALTSRGVAAAVPQDESRAVVWRKRSPADGRIDFRMSGSAIDRLVRALHPPYPGAEAVHSEIGAIVVREVAVRSDRTAVGPVEPGRVVATRDGAPVVATSDGAVVLTDYACAAGGRPEIRLGSSFC